MKNDDTMTIESNIQERPESQTTARESDRPSTDEQADANPTRQIMVRLDSGYVLLSPTQFAALCVTS
jgi:hypothetical protein